MKYITTTRLPDSFEEVDYYDCTGMISVYPEGKNAPEWKDEYKKYMGVITPEGKFEVMSICWYEKVNGRTAFCEAKCLGRKDD